MRMLIVTGAIALVLAPLAAQRRGSDNGAVWAHLQKTYDKDGDGKITPAEYGRGERSFQNLDRDGDEMITEADFERRRGRSRGGRPGAGEPDRRAMLARTIGDMYGSFLNTDGKPGLSRDDWDAAVARMKPSEDGAIARENVANILGLAAETRMASMMSRRLVGTFDSDRDGKLTVGDMDALFRLLDADGSGTVEQGREIDMPPGVGEMAPDFTLPFADDANKKVTLSSFRGKKPVALIFGSYT